MSKDEVARRGQLSAADLKALSEAMKAAKPTVESAASLARAAAGIMKGK